MFKQKKDFLLGSVISECGRAPIKEQNSVERILNKCREFKKRRSVAIDFF